MIAVDIIAKELSDRELKLWTFPGGTIAPLYDACRRLGVETLVARSEYGAGMMAVGAYKATRNLQFCAVTSGPGATNIVTPIAEAWADSCPIIFVTGQVSTSSLVGFSRQKGFQQTDIVAIVSRITKNAYMVTRADRLAGALDRSIEIALEGRCGPCLLDIPTDIARCDVE